VAADAKRVHDYLMNEYRHGRGFIVDALRVKPPENFPPRKYTYEERRYIAVSAFYLFNANNRRITPVIHGLIALSELLMKPENYIKVKSGQYIEKAINTRTIADKTNEAEQELTELSKYTAYARILQGQSVWKGKIQTKELPDIQTMMLYDWKRKKIHL
jgi:hypothetical protein